MELNIMFVLLIFCNINITYSFMENRFSDRLIENNFSLY